MQVIVNMEKIDLLIDYLIKNKIVESNGWFKMVEANEKDKQAGKIDIRKKLNKINRDLIIKIK